MTITETTAVSRTALLDEERSNYPAELFGMLFPLKLEPTIYGITDRIAPAYRGGVWRFWRLANGGFYMAPDAEETLQAHCMNYWEGAVGVESGDAVIGRGYVELTGYGDASRPGI